MKNSNEKEKASSDFFTTWIDPPTSNNGKWRFIGIPYWICNNPGGDWVWGRPNLPPINIWKMVLANEPLSSHQLSNCPFGHFFSTNLPYQKKNPTNHEFHSTSAQRTRSCTLKHGGWNGTLLKGDIRSFFGGGGLLGKPDQPLARRCHLVGLAKFHPTGWAKLRGV